MSVTPAFFRKGLSLVSWNTSAQETQFPSAASFFVWTTNAIFENRASKSSSEASATSRSSASSPSESSSLVHLGDELELIWVIKVKQYIDGARPSADMEGLAEYDCRKRCQSLLAIEQ
ncbi:MAG: hypothetical protein WDN04_14160 [Rhodospirillales bacterium]